MHAGVQPHAHAHLLDDGEPEEASEHLEIAKLLRQARVGREHWERAHARASLGANEEPRRGRDEGLGDEGEPFAAHGGACGVLVLEVDLEGGREVAAQPDARVVLGTYLWCSARAVVSACMRGRSSGAINVPGAARAPW